MRYAKKMIWSVFILFTQLWIVSTQVSGATSIMEEVSSSIWCPCDCAMLLSNCECATADEVGYQIDQMINQGKTKDQIINELQGKYGKKILAMPKKSGLELLLWVVPVTAAVGGTAIILLHAHRKTSITEFKGGKYEKEELRVVTAKYDQIFNEEYRNAKKEAEKK